MSHEFRTPLTLLLGPLEDAIAEGRGVDDTEDLTAMHASALRLLGMVNGLLEVTRVDVWPRTARPEAIDLVTLTTDLARPFAVAAERSGLRVEVDVDPTVGVVLLDPGLYETALTNLVANAIKYTPAGRVGVVLRLVGERIELVVADSGIGIPEPEHQRIFERFHRVGGPEGRTIEGTGIGLTLVADAVSALGGTIAVTSEVGAGSTFTVTLPHVASADPPSGALSAAQPATARAAAFAAHVAPSDDRPVSTADVSPGRRVIVVADDNPGMRRRLVQVLGGLGEVVTCVDGAEALDVLRRRPVDLLVSDVMMPRLDGVSLVRAVRDDAVLSAVPVVLLTARAGTGAVAEALDAGADDYVVKPFTRSELVARCRTTMELAAVRATRAADEARTAMLAGISHDMQTPLSVITAVLEVLGDADLDPARRSQLVARGADRAGQLEQLVGQFLDWSRVAAGVAIEVRGGSVDLAALAAEVADRHARAEVVAADPVVLTCDRTRIDRVLQNVLDNACALARSRVGVEVRRTPAGAEVHVVDDGPGVAEHVLPRLFTAFSPTHGYGGHGLGLFVSREAARAHGGDLVLAETGPTGSRFVLTLPDQPPTGSRP